MVFVMRHHLLVRSGQSPVRLITEVTAPTALLIDTCILEQGGFQFERGNLAEVRKACRAAGIRLLMPKPIELEVRRHIRERCEEAAKALSKAGRQAPLLKGRDGWPLKDMSPAEFAGKLSTQHQTAFDSFMHASDAVSLGYEGVDLAWVMARHDTIAAPFTPKKRAEFPDAITVSILRNYTQACGAVAIVSADKGFRDACRDECGPLHVYESIPEFFSDNSWIPRASAIVDDIAHRVSDLEELIADAATDTVDVRVVDEWDADTEDIEVSVTEVDALTVTSQEEHSCVVTFSAAVKVSGNVHKPDPDTGIYDKEENVWLGREYVNQPFELATELTATCTVELSRNGSVVAFKNVDIDQTVFDISVSPHDY